VINKGLLQQIDTPQSLYDRPDNLFVAGFIGSPAMNFFSATLDKADGRLYVNAKSFRVQIPESRTDVYMPYSGKQIIFGIRPEDIHNPQFAPPSIDAQPVEAVVDVTELMGNEITVYLKSGEHNFVARVDPRARYVIGDPIQVAFNMDNMHIFDAESEKAIR
jgi:multiple sugar transport system ATP-binding protein